MEVPCGQCIGCRRDRARAWAIRIMAEAHEHERNSFLTLTYAEDPISLRVDDLQRFFKRLRKRGVSVRHYSCGEYGDQLGRPHFHVCLFGEDFSGDRYQWATRNGLPVWRSPLLEEVWTAGLSEIGSLTFDSAAYVARYVTKKVREPSGLFLDDGLWPHYSRIDPDSGELHLVKPEFSVMSRGGRRKGHHGIGAVYAEKYLAEIVRDDSVIFDGREAKLPRYFDSIIETHFSEKLAELKAARKKAASSSPDNTPDRLAVRETVCRARLQLKRKGSYEA